jgi:pilus assembly protein FimV
MITTKVSAVGALILGGLASIAVAQTAPVAAPVAPATKPTVAAPAVTPAPAVTAPAAAAPVPVTAAAPAAKQADPAMAKFWASCTADVEKYCPEAAAQRKALAAATAAGQAPAPGTKGPGRGVVVACLNTNAAKLSPVCKAAFDERKAAAQAKKG